MSRRKHKHEEHENAERWLLTYADLITLLLGLFVILYASSQVDQKKFIAVVQAFGRIFEGGSGVLQGTPSMLQGNEVPAPGEVKGDDDVARQLQEALESSVKEAIAEGRVSLSATDGGVTVHVTEKLLFATGSDVLRGEAAAVLDKLGASLQDLPNEIRVEGHTDDTPIHTAAFPSNWHLSTARALNVGLYMLGHSTIKPERLAIVGYGEHRPIAPNDSDVTRAKNRRVDIVIVK